MVPAALFASLVVSCPLVLRTIGVGIYMPHRELIPGLPDKRLLRRWMSHQIGELVPITAVDVRRPAGQLFYIPRCWEVQRGNHFQENLGTGVVKLGRRFGPKRLVNSLCF